MIKFGKMNAMKLNKSLLFVLVLTISIVQCKKDEEPDEMMEFNPHVSCIINSVDFNTSQLEIFQGQNTLQIVATASESVLTIEIENPLEEGLTLPLDGTTISRAVYEDLNNNVVYISENGSITLNRWDEMSRELEGTFQFQGIQFFGPAEINVINGSMACFVP